MHQSPRSTQTRYRAHGRPEAAQQRRDFELVGALCSDSVDHVPNHLGPLLPLLGRALGALLDFLPKRLESGNKLGAVPDTH